MNILRKVLIIIVLLSIVFGFEIFLNKVTTKSISYIKDKLSNIEKSLDEGKNGIDDLIDAWQKIDKKLSFYMEHNELEKVTLNVNKLKKQLEIKENKDAYQTIAELNYLLDHLEKKQRTRIENIF